MGKEYRDCIVTLIDLIGVEKLAQSGEASKLMREFHKLVTQEKGNLSAIDHAYVWNDSALLLSYVDDHNASYEAAMRDANKLKRRVDTVRNSYAIAVKGQAFPPVRGRGKAANASGVIFIRASSWAMANCFKIEEKIKALRKAWALDDWIKERIKTELRYSDQVAIPLLPSKKRRNVYFFDGYLWGPACGETS